MTDGGGPLNSIEVDDDDVCELVVDDLQNDDPYLDDELCDPYLDDELCDPCLDDELRDADDEFRDPCVDDELRDPYLDD